MPFSISAEVDFIALFQRGRLGDSTENEAQHFDRATWLGAVVW
jgi:hypothetical protein